MFNIPFQEYPVTITFTKGKTLAGMQKQMTKVFGQTLLNDLEFEDQVRNSWEEHKTQHIFPVYTNSEMILIKKKICDTLGRRRDDAPLYVFLFMVK